jgi:hypothetical protein
MHLDLVGQQEPVVLLLDGSTQQWHELHLDVFRLLVAGAAVGLVYIEEACAASRHVYTLGHELHLDMSNPQGHMPTDCRTCALRFKINLITVSRVPFTSEIIFLQYVRHVTGNDKDYLRKIPRVVW